MHGMKNITKLVVAFRNFCARG